MSEKSADMAYLRVVNWDQLPSKYKKLIPEQDIKLVNAPFYPHCFGIWERNPPHPISDHNYYDYGYHTILAFPYSEKSSQTQEKPLFRFNKINFSIDWVGQTLRLTVTSKQVDEGVVKVIRDNKVSFCWKNTFSGEKSINLRDYDIIYVKIPTIPASSSYRVLFLQLFQNSSPKVIQNNIISLLSEIVDQQIIDLKMVSVFVYSQRVQNRNNVKSTR